MALRLTHSGTSHQALSPTNKLRRSLIQARSIRAAAGPGSGTGALPAILGTGRVTHELLTLDVHLPGG